MKKRTSAVVTWLIIIFSASSIILAIKSFSPIKAAEEQVKIELVTDEMKQVRATFTFQKTQQQMVLLHTQGFKELDKKQLLAKGNTKLEDTEDNYTKVLVIEASDQPVSLTIDLTPEDIATQGRVSITGTNQEIIAEKTVEFQPKMQLEQEASERPNETRGRQKRAVTRNILSPPADSLPLLNVFREPIGTGPELINDKKVLRITKDEGSQIGAIWSKRKLNLKKDFHLKTYLYLGNRQANAGDGMTFTLQNDSRMNGSDTKVLGAAGMGLGAYQVSRNSNSYIRNALSIEFDTYYNSGSDNRMDREVGENYRRGHVAFVTPGPQNNSYSGQHHSWKLAPTYLSNGTWRTLEVVWKSSTQTLTYDLSGVGTDSYKISDLNQKFGGTEVYWGFTGSTGGFYAENAVAITQLPENIDQKAEITNVTQNSERKEQVAAKRNDRLLLENNLIFDGNSITVSDGAKIRVNLAKGLTYQTNSLKLDDVNIPESSIQIQNNQLVISNLFFSSSNVAYKISLEVLVTSNENDVLLTSTFDYLSEREELVSSSNAIVAQIPLLKGNVTIHYVDKDNKNLAAQKIINQKVGTAYKEAPLSIKDYLYDKTEGNASGLIQEEAQEVYFYYKKAKANLTIIFQDESEQPLHEAIIKEKLIGETIDLTKDSEVKQAVANILSKRYLLEPSGRPKDETAILINSGGTKAIYTFQGTLSIYSGPTEINFGKHEVSWKGLTDNNPSYDQPLIIWDNRKHLNSWKLSLKLENELSIPDSPSHILKGVLSYQTATDKKTLSVEAQEILQATHESSGQYNVTKKTWGPNKQGLRLNVPSGAVKLTGDYETTLIWRIEEAY